MVYCGRRRQELEDVDPERRERYSKEAVRTLIEALESRTYDGAWSEAFVVAPDPRPTPQRPAS
jgi:hypothetical protein